MNATLALVVDGTRQAKERRMLDMPRYLRGIQIEHDRFMARHGVTEPATVHARRTPAGRRVVAITSGPVTSVVTFDR